MQKKKVWTCWRLKILSQNGYGDDKIAIGYVEGHVLDGGEIHTYEPRTEKWGQLDISGVVYFDTYEDILLIVRINEDKDAHYTIMEQDGLIPRNGRCRH